MAAVQAGAEHGTRPGDARSVPMNIDHGPGVHAVLFRPGEHRDVAPAAPLESPVMGDDAPRRLL